jgi:hypothetical protein
VLTYLILFTSLNAFARVPEVDVARALVEQVVETILNEEGRARWVEDTFLSRGPEGEFLRLTPDQAVSLLESVRFGGSLYNGVASSEVVETVVSGPDYVRVILGGEVRFSFVVVLYEGLPQIVDWAVTNCGQCSEPSRFLTDLVQSVNNQSTGIYRLLPGIELIRSDSERLSPSYPGWVRALHSRNVTAGYTRSILTDARIIGSSGNSVHVELSGDREEWTVDFLNGRWVLLYDELEPDSVLRLDHSDESSFTDARDVAGLRSELWEPVAIELDNQTLLDRDTLYVGPRQLYSDIVMYGQDIGRRWAQIALIEQRSLRPILSSSVPTISSRLKVDISGWTNEFSFSLSPNERHLLIGAYDLGWIIDLDTGAVIWEKSDFRAVSTLGWSGGGEQFAIAECRNFANDEARRSPSESVGSCLNGEVHLYNFDGERAELSFSKRISEHRSSLVAYDGGLLWSVGDNGQVVVVSLDERVATETAEQPVCDEYESGRYQPSFRQLLFACVSAPDDLESDASTPRERRTVTVDLTTHQISQAAVEGVSRHERMLSISPSGRSVLVEGNSTTQVVRLSDGARFRVTDSRLYNPQWSSDERDIYGVDPVGNGSRWRITSISE